MRKAMLLALALPLSGSALAASIATSEDKEPRWYQADIIVFRYLKETSNEAWPPVALHPLPANTITLKRSEPVQPEFLGGSILESTEPTSAPVPPDLAREPFISLPGSDFMLSRESGILKRSSGYRVIAQSAWRMPVDEHIREQPVKITATSAKGNHYLLSGTVTVSASRYLHVETDLWLNELAPEALYGEISGQTIPDHFTDIAEDGVQSGAMIRLNPEDPPLRITRNFQLKEKRRIKRSEEVQYLDSPVIGVLFKLTPYQPPTSILEISDTETGPDLKQPLVSTLSGNL